MLLLSNNSIHNTFNPVELADMTNDHVQPPSLILRLNTLSKKIAELGINKGAIRGSLSAFFISTFQFISELIFYAIALEPIDAVESIINYGSKFASYVGAGWLLGDSASVLANNFRKKEQPFIPPVAGGVNYALSAKIGFAIGIIIAVTALVYIGDTFTFGMSSAFFLPVITHAFGLCSGMASASSYIGRSFDDVFSGLPLPSFMRSNKSELALNSDKTTHFERKWTKGGTIAAIGLAVLVFALVGFGVVCPPFGFGIVGGAMIVSPWIVGLGSAATVISTIGFISNIIGLVKDKLAQRKESLSFSGNKEIKQPVSKKIQDLFKPLVKQYIAASASIQKVMSSVFSSLIKQVFLKTIVNRVIILPPPPSQSSNNLTPFQNINKDKTQSKFITLFNNKL